MFSMDHVLARDNDHGVSGAKPERTARYQKLIVRPNEIGYRRSYRNRHKACAYPGGVNKRSRDASTPHGIPGGLQVILKECGHA